MSEKLKNLMHGTILTGMISSVHVENLRMYPFIFLDGIDQAELSYNFPTMGEAADSSSSRVSYTLKMHEGHALDPRSPKTVEGVENLRKAVNVLMQHRVVVKVFNEQGKEIGASIEPGSESKS